MQDYYMEQALKEAEKAYKKLEVPVGAVIVKDAKRNKNRYNKACRNNSNSKSK